MSVALHTRFFDVPDLHCRKSLDFVLTCHFLPSRVYHSCTTVYRMVLDLTGLYRT